MSLSGYIRTRMLGPAIENRTSVYQNIFSENARLALQLEKFNKLWGDICLQIPYYAELCKKKDLPDKFLSWEEYIEKVPVIKKKTIQKNSTKMFNPSHKAEFYRITGGTTSQPIQIPAWFSENKETQPDIWMARSWYGIKPDSRLFLIWGHSHLFGSGIKGKINEISRNVKDWLLNYKRFSAYDMNPIKMRQAAKEMIKFAPDYVIGYSVALDAFARANHGLMDELRKLGIKVVIGAAEGFPQYDSEKLIGDIFDCPVAMEYGSVETNLIGHTSLSGGYSVFWQNYFVEAIDAGNGNSRVLRVTSLYPRCFPLIRYEMGDYVDVYEEDSGAGLVRFKSIMGRCNLFVLLKDQTRVHSEVFTHCVRDFVEIYYYQVVQTKDSISLLIIPGKNYSKEIEKTIRDRLGKIHPDLYEIQFHTVEKLRQTIAGKTPMIIRE